jgi:hypothetical protein
LYCSNETEFESSELELDRVKDRIV